jgi:hypothetical protein
LRSAPFPTAQASFGPVVATGSCGEKQPRRECRLGDEADAYLAHQRPREERAVRDGAGAVPLPGRRPC